MFRPPGTWKVPTNVGGGEGKAEAPGARDGAFEGEEDGDGRTPDGSGGGEGSTPATDGDGDEVLGTGTGSEMRAHVQERDEAHRTTAHSGP